MWVGREGLSWIADVKGLVHKPDSLDNLPLWPKTEHWKVKVHTDLSCEVIFIDSMFKWHVKALKATFFAIFICGQHRKLLWALYLRTFGDQRIGNCLSAIVTETLSLWNQKEVVWKKIYKKGGGGAKTKNDASYTDKKGWRMIVLLNTSWPVVSHRDLCWDQFCTLCTLPRLQMTSSVTVWGFISMPMTRSYTCHSSL